MGKAANTAKTKWNAANYAQVKVSVDPGIASAFKAACASNGTSMAGELSRFMAGYVTEGKKRNPVPSGDMSTRRKRRSGVVDIISRMEIIRDAESRSHDNVPESLRGTDAYGDTEEIISMLDEAIDLLGTIY